MSKSLFRGAAASVCISFLLFLLLLLLFSLHSSFHCLQLPGNLFGVKFEVSSFHVVIVSFPFCSPFPVPLGVSSPLFLLSLWWCSSGYGCPFSPNCLPHPQHHFCCFLLLRQGWRGGEEPAKTIPGLVYLFKLRFLTPLLPSLFSLTSLLLLLLLLSISYPILL